MPRNGLRSNPAAADPAGTIVVSSSEEDDEGIPAVPTPKASRTKTSGARHNQHNKIQVELPKRKRSADTGTRSSGQTKRRRSNEEDNNSEEAGPGEGHEDQVATGGQDDESAPTDSAFWNRVQAAVNPNADHIREAPKPKLTEQSAPQAENEIDAEVEEAESGVPRAPQNGTEIRLNEDGADTQQTEQDAAENSTKTKPAMQSWERNKRRQSKKKSFGEAGYEAPRVASPELGGNSSPPKTAPPSDDKEPQKGKSEQYVVEASKSEDENEGAEQLPEGAPVGEENDEVKSTAADDAHDDVEEAQDTNDGDQSIMMGDDSVFIAPPQDTKDLLTIKLSVAYLNSILYNMRQREWTHEGKDWIDDVLRCEDEDDQAWLKRQRIVVRRSLCRDLVKCLIRLWDYCHQMPKAPDFGGQYGYIQKHSATLRTQYGHVRKLIDDICTRISAEAGSPVAGQAEDATKSREWAEKATKDLYTRVIPLLVLIIREAFLVGAPPRKIEGDQLPRGEEYEFTSSTLDILIRAVGWTQRLFNTMKAELEAHPPTTVTAQEQRLRKIATERQLKTEVHLNNLSRSFLRALNQLEQLAREPQERKEAEERDKAIKAERERKERERWEAEELKMQRFIRSTQRLTQELTSSYPPGTQQVRSWQPGQQRHEPRPDRDAYFEKHGGWYYWEDDRLLNMIRKVLRPNVGALVSLVPHRSADEVVERVQALKDRMRLKYESSNMEPPLWCYHHD